ncbi:hypothetical protein B0H12DRAFT_1236798 [Mycena haematopus]|nr:hypothetical protein B0H12DRAFT_1236798 [Mycena haematopus]
MIGAVALYQCHRTIVARHRFFGRNHKRAWFSEVFPPPSQHRPIVFGPARRPRLAPSRLCAQPSPVSPHCPALRPRLLPRPTSPPSSLSDSAAGHVIARASRKRGGYKPPTQRSRSRPPHVAAAAAVCEDGHTRGGMAARLLDGGDAPVVCPQRHARQGGGWVESRSSRGIRHRRRPRRACRTSFASAAVPFRDPHSRHVPALRSPQPPRARLPSSETTNPASRLAHPPLPARPRSPHARTSHSLRRQTAGLDVTVVSRSPRPLPLSRPPLARTSCAPSKTTNGEFRRRRGGPLRSRSPRLAHPPPALSACTSAATPGSRTVLLSFSTPGARRTLARRRESASTACACGKSPVSTHGHRPSASRDGWTKTMQAGEMGGWVERIHVGEMHAHSLVVANPCPRGVRFACVCI